MLSGLRCLFLDGYYTTLPRTSWYDVNYKGNINKNSIRKYLAYSIDVEVKNDGTTRKRRSAEPGSYVTQDPYVFDERIHLRSRRNVVNDTVTTVSPTALRSATNVNFEIGSQTECVDPKNPNIPCNGPPVNTSSTFRYGL